MWGRDRVLGGITTHFATTQSRWLLQSLRSLPDRQSRGFCQEIMLYSNFTYSSYTCFLIIVAELVCTI